MKTNIKLSILSKEQGISQQELLVCACSAVAAYTFHYFVGAGTVTKPKDIDVLRSATVIQLRTQSDAILFAFGEHCQQRQVLTITAASYGGARVWLTVDQLMAIATRCAQSTVYGGQSRNVVFW